MSFLEFHPPRPVKVLVFILHHQTNDMTRYGDVICIESCISTFELLCRHTTALVHVVLLMTHCISHLQHTQQVSTEISTIKLCGYVCMKL